MRNLAWIEQRQKWRREIERLETLLVRTGDPEDSAAFASALSASAAAPTVEAKTAVPSADEIAQFIRQADGAHQMGAGALGERLHEWLATPAQAEAPAGQGEAHGTLWCDSDIGPREPARRPHKPSESDIEEAIADVHKRMYPHEHGYADELVRKGVQLAQRYATPLPAQVQPAEQVGTKPLRWRVSTGGYKLSDENGNDIDLATTPVYAALATPAPQPTVESAIAAQEWHEAVLAEAEDSGLDAEIVESIFATLLPHFLRDKEEAGYVTLRLTDLVESDSYGVYGSDFYRCRICHSESGAGVLNKGIEHESNCPLRSAAASPHGAESAEARDAAHLLQKAREWVDLGGYRDYLGVPDGYKNRDRARALLKEIDAALSTQQEEQGRGDK